MHIMKLVDIIFEFLKGKGVDPYECHPECPDCSNNSQYEGIDCWCIPLYDRDRWKELAEGLAEAITNEGISPEYHHKVMARHRSEWKVLWKRIDAILEAVRNDKNY